MRLIVVGASGLIGGTIYEEAKNKGYEVLGTYLSYKLNNLYKLDYGIRSEVSKLLDKFSPQIIFCPAGISHVDWIEQNPQKAWKVNVEKLSILLEAAQNRGTTVAFFSSDYIFDGKNGPYSEVDTPNPLNFYGQHKLAAERMLKNILGSNHYIFRTSHAFGFEKQGKNFVYTLLKNLSSNKEIEVASNIFISPTYINDIARFSLAIVEKNTKGTFNLSGEEHLSRYDFAKRIAYKFNLNESLIKPVKFENLNSITKRPLRSCLKNEKATKLAGLKWTPLDTALSEIKNLMDKNRQIKREEKICIFIPCFNASATLPKLLERIPEATKVKVKEILIVDNNSTDQTYLLAAEYRKHSDIENLKILKNIKNFGYGGSQKLAYAYAINQNYDIVIMLHGDAQYSPEKLPLMIDTIEKDKSIDLLFGSRITGNPLKGGMPLHRFLGNKALTHIQNLFLGTNISEFHSGYRIFRTKALKEVPFHLCGNYYHFDTEIIILFIKNKLKIAEVPVDTHYGNEKCYVNIWKYGFRVLLSTFCFWLHTKGLRKYKLYKDGLKADTDRILKELKTEVY